VREFAANFGGVKKKEKKKQFFDLPAVLEYLQELWNKGSITFSVRATTPFAHHHLAH
jgi:hypothetical protein